MIESKFNILLIESSSRVCSVALALNGSLAFEYNAHSGNMHDYLLADYIQSILRDAKISPDEIHALALTAGPGSFTGLRIGASTAKGFCFGSNTKLISINTMDAIFDSIPAYIKSKHDSIITIIPSHKDLYYVRQYSPIGISDIELIKLNEIIEKNKEIDLFAGNLAGLENELTNSIQINLTAKNLLPRALANISALQFEDIESFTPLYYQEFYPKQ